MSGGVQGLDRYSYVFNNPMNYVDPSGHYYIPAQHSWQCGPDGIYCDINYEILNRYKLTPAGQNAYDIYIGLYKDKEGWWWSDPNLGGDSSFTVTDYITLVYILELGSMYSNDTYTSQWIEGMTRSYYSWMGEMESKYPGKYATSPGTIEANLNFTAAYAGNFRDEPADFHYRAETKTSSRIVLTLLNTIRNPTLAGHADWASGCVNGAPCRPGSYTSGYGSQLPYIYAFIHNGCQPRYSIFGDCSIGNSFAFFLDLYASTIWGAWKP